MPDFAGKQACSMRVKTVGDSSVGEAETALVLVLVQVGALQRGDPGDRTAL